MSLDTTSERKMNADRASSHVAEVDGSHRPSSIVAEQRKQTSSPVRPECRDRPETTIAGLRSADIGPRERGEDHERQTRRRSSVRSVSDRWPRNAKGQRTRVAEIDWTTYPRQAMLECFHIGDCGDADNVEKALCNQCDHPRISFRDRMMALIRQDKFDLAPSGIFLMSRFY